VRTVTVAAALLAAVCSTFTLVGPSGRLVHTSAELSAALRQGGHIVLADGTYDAGSPFAVGTGTTVTAQHPGRAILRAGLLVTGTGVTLVGLTVDGRRRIEDGIDVRAPAGFVGRQLVVRNVTGDGIVVDTYPHRVRPDPVPLLVNVDVAGVARPVPRSSNGTAEACLWLGVQVTLRGARLRDCAWDGLWTGFDSVDATYTDVDVDRTPVGVYIEHYTTGSTFSGLLIGAHVRTGVVCEWADPAYGRRPACVGNTIRDSVFDSFHVGVYLDEGTRTTSVVDSVFRGQGAAAIVDFRGRGNRYRGNVYGAGVVRVTNDHP
jgi:hypothetical protein